MDTLISNVTVVTMNERMEVLFGACIGIADGKITYIGKTATVMVPSAGGEYRDRSGRRYEKFRVPLSKLHIVS